MHHHLKGLVPLHNINHQVASPTLHILSLQAMLNPLAIPSQCPPHNIPPLHKQGIQRIAGTTSMELLTRLTRQLLDVGPSHKRPCPEQEQCSTLRQQTILKLHNILTPQLVLLQQLLHIPQTIQRMLATVVVRTIKSHPSLASPLCLNISNNLAPVSGSYDSAPEYDNQAYGTESRDYQETTQYQSEAPYTESGYAQPAPSSRSATGGSSSARRGDRDSRDERDRHRRHR